MNKRKKERRREEGREEGKEERKRERERKGKKALCPLPNIHSYTLRVSHSEFGDCGQGVVKRSLYTLCIWTLPCVQEQIPFPSKSGILESASSHRRPLGSSMGPSPSQRGCLLPQTSETPLGGH